MKVLLRGPLLTNSGYGVHSRQIFEWLDGRDDVELFVQCLNWGTCSWIVNPAAYGGLIGKIMSKSTALDGKTFDMSFQVQLPNEWDPSIANKNIGISAFVETDKCNPAWIQCCNNMDQVIVPSTFTKNVVKRSGILTVPITVIPEWFNSHIINKSQCDKIASNDDRYDFDTKFNIMIFGLLTSLNSDDDRKNLINTIIWTLETLDGKDDVGIILKSCLGKGSTSDKIQCRQILKEITSRFRKTNFPKIHFIHGNMSPEEVGALYSSNSIKAFATATRGEGYGLPIIDAAASGIPIIATGWSGHLEFLDKDLFHSVDYSLEQIKNSKIDKQIFLEGFRWAEPKKESFCNELKSLYNNYKSSKSNANQLKKKICTNFYKSSIKKMYDKIIDGE